MKLQSDILNRFDFAKKNFESYNQKIINRIDEIIQVILKEIGMKRKDSGWRFYCSSSNEKGIFQIDEIENENFVLFINNFHLTYEALEKLPLSILDKNDEIIEILNDNFGSIPARWLFEDFEEEFKNGYEKYKNQ